MILRRLYIYLVGIWSLIALAFGLIELGHTAAYFVLNLPTGDSERTALAGFSATVVVALPVWAIHMWFARRFARRDPADRASALRRLYLYLACLGSSIGAAIAISSTVADALQMQQAGFPDPYERLLTVQSAWAAAVLLAIWAFHYRIAARDRAVVGEQGASATLRRWYMYTALFVGLFMMLAGIQGVIQLEWVRALNSNLFQFTPLSPYIGGALGGSLLWGFHARVLATRHVAEDRTSTLRAVEGFIAVGVCIVVALVGATEVLYFTAARALGVENPAGLGDSIAAGLAQPTSNIVVYGIAWFLIRRRLHRDAGGGEAARQAGIRRLYTNLAALVSMIALAVGAADVLGVLLQQIEAQIIGLSAPDWRDPISLWSALLVVGAAVWVAHWRQVPWLEERLALSRRMYVWAALLGSVLAVLGGGIGLLYVVFQQLFSVQPRLSDPNLSFAPSLAVIVVAAATGFYHLRVLRSDAAARHAHTPPAPAPSGVPVVTVPATPAERTPELEVAPGLHFELSVAGATEDDIHQALTNLPPQASYKLRPSDRPA